MSSTMARKRSRLGDENISNKIPCVQAASHMLANGSTKIVSMKSERKPLHDPVYFSLPPSRDENFTTRNDCQRWDPSISVKTFHKNSWFLSKFRNETEVDFTRFTKNQKNQGRNPAEEKDLAASGLPMSNGVIWSPKSREEWEECLDEMVNLCADAALRSSTLRGLRNEDPPLTREYIEDRINIDDPLRGYQIRCKYEGDLQGFVMTTTFTTWTNYFKWDSKHPAAGIRFPRKNQLLIERLSRTRDKSGQFASELESQPRNGDGVSGVVWNTIAEISLIGALGCGEYLLRMALDDIRKQGHYKYVALQATKSSCSFYERFGFVRVGAVARYDFDPNSKVVGYRHWTYAEEQINREKHGGPSLMMVKKISKDTPSILDALGVFFVTNKPYILPEADRTHTIEQKTTEKLSENIEQATFPRDSKSFGTIIHSKSTRKKTMEGSPLIPRPRNRKAINNNLTATRTNSNGTKDVEFFKHASAQTLRKQVCYHRDNPNNPSFYNKVVRYKFDKNTKKLHNQFRQPYYFVVHYNLSIQTLILMPMKKDGIFMKGGRAGRVRWKVDFNSYGRSISHASSCNFEIVRSDHVAKKGFIYEERWDVHDN
uniref:N-acetyltransferase domain-containing protein n=1 Tax=Corethron hystrix TaxID=216773 RepID=A0A7S1FVJ1_9STRA|mmetsp:Transcript_34242/g.79087  ORF Transcript_34242/g.79087 Transcript_34242/m.79087 type:complete len:599 (+) Transcript_34242:122-1918(+)